MSRNFVFMSHSVQEFSFLIQNTSRNFFSNCNVFPPSEEDAGYFFRSPVAVGLFLREHDLQGIFFSKKPTPAVNDQMFDPK